jgi:hypothetical protein
MNMYVWLLSVFPFLRKRFNRFDELIGRFALRKL